MARATPASGQIIYYLSPELVDQLYRQELGVIGDTTKTTGVRNEQKLSLKATLGAIWQKLGGPALDGQGQIQHATSNVETLAIKGSVEERAALLLNHFLATNRLRNISDILESDRYESLYIFSLPARIAPKKVGRDSFIEVTHTSDSLAFSGLTSETNWASPSLRNNLLWAAAKNPAKVVSIFGILFPLTVVKESEVTRLSVQYLLIGTSR